MNALQVRYRPNFLVSPEIEYFHLCAVRYIEGVILRIGAEIVPSAFTANDGFF